MFLGVTYISIHKVESGLTTANDCPACMLLPLYMPENWSMVPLTGLRTIIFQLLLQGGIHFTTGITIGIHICLPCTQLALYQ